MGRKIPGKKHRGVKDPFKQQAKRHAELEAKINAPPKDVSDQPMPKSLERVVKLKEAVKSGKIGKIKKKRKKGKLICIGKEDLKKLHPKAKPDKVVPIFQQKPGEAPHRFLNRVYRETDAFINETTFEKKYGVQVKRDPRTGRVEGVDKAPKDELDEIEKLRAKHNNTKKKKKKKKGEDIPKMTKAEKKKEKLRLKKEKKEEMVVNDFEDFKDEVQFGEVVHAPPQLKTRPRKVDTETSAKPARKELLLHSLLKKDETPKTNSSKMSIDRAGKRKNLPVGERRQLEKQQSDVIAAYRRLKADRSLTGHT